MANPTYVMLTRQQGLTRAIDTVANNLANMSTNGYRAEKVVFSEHVKSVTGPMGSLSMATANGRYMDVEAAPLTKTGGMFDFAIQGDGYFMIATPDGDKLTRFGAFGLDANGALATPDGFAVLDEGGAPIVVPGNAQEISVGDDGVISANGVPIGRMGIYTVATPQSLRPTGGVMLEMAEPPILSETASVAQGFLEDSNVDPMTEITRLIDIQRAYEMGQAIMQREDERMRQAISTLGESV